MSTSSAYSYSSTFTIVHAREIASRVAADMNLCALYYGSPSQAVLPDYLEELAQYIKAGYVESYEFGFKKNGARVAGACWCYKAGASGVLESDRPGRIDPSADVSGAVYYNYLTQNAKWFALTDSERAAFRASLPIQRTSGTLPTDGSGRWISDKTYSAGGAGVSRQSFIPY